ncbi:porin [Alcanivorax hongdengensis]|uniref:porin n=1 Tax=Alcanivorax hongdengensis TaxID=519051 RepID=UPI0002D267CB|nr:porin [Alcanivorax hongdengensis]
MKKTLLAVSVAACLAPASVMAAPAFYGKINLSLDKYSDYPDMNQQLNPGSLDDAWYVESNNSRLGLRGDEKVRNTDLTILYQLEAGYDVDGDSGQTFSTRNSYLGLGTNVGKFFAGRYDSVVKQAEGRIDQFNDTLADMDTLFLGQRRNSNTLNWESLDYSGLTFRAQLAPGEETAVGTDTKDGLADTWGLSATFEKDSLYAALAYESSYATVNIPSTPVTSVGVDTDLIRASAGLKLSDDVQVGAIIERAELDPNLAGADKADSMSYLVSGRVGVSERVALKGQFGWLDSSDLDADVKVLTLGADYQLAEQARAYALVSLSDTNFDDTTVDVDETGNAFSVGMVYSF